MDRRTWSLKKLIARARGIYPISSDGGGITIPSSLDFSNQDNSQYVPLIF